MAKYIDDFVQGETRTFVFDYGITTDITGWVFRLTIWKDGASKATAIVNTTAGSDPRDIATEGKCYLTLPSNITATIPADKYYYAFERTIAGSPEDVRVLMPPFKDRKDKLEVGEGVPDNT